MSQNKWPVDGPSEGLFYINNRVHVNYKADPNVAPGAKYPLQDLTSRNKVSKAWKIFVQFFV